MTPPQAPDRRPRLVLFDVFETLLRLAPLRQRFVDAGRPEEELERFFLRTLRDGMALTLAGSAAPPFAEVARAALHTTTGHTLDDATADHILAGFRQLPPHEDVPEAFDALDRAGVPAYAFTHGSAETARAALERAGLHRRLSGVLSAEEIHAFKPATRVYHWACDRVGTAPAHTALVAAHSWDTHGALRAGLLAGFVTRLEGRLSPVVDRPHVVADRLDEVVSGLLALPQE